MRLVLITLTVAAAAQSPNKDNKDAELGKAPFRIYCAPCHGRNAEGGRAPDLTRGTFNAGDRDRDLIRVIEQGVSGTDMNGYGAIIARENVERIIAYIRSVTQAPMGIAGDPALGETLFWGKSGCGGCHAVGARGGNYGPDLIRIGRSRSAAHLRDAMLKPDKHITPGFSTLVIETRSGKKLMGLELGFDQFSAQLREADGSYHSFLREEVKSVTRLPKSLMPSYEGKLSDAELNGVLMYLMSLKGEPRP